MPKIPTYQKQVLPPGSAGGVLIDPGAASASMQGLQRAGAGMASLGYDLGRMAEREQKAHDAIKATQIETALSAAKRQISESYQGRTDYQNFSPDLEETLNGLREQLAPVDESPQLQAAFEKAFSTQAEVLRNVITTKKWDVMGQVGKIAFDDLLTESLDEYATETDPEKRSIIKNQLFMKGQQLQGEFAVDPIWVEEQLDAFDVKADKVIADRADVTADEIIMEDPAKALEWLKSDYFLPDLEGKARQDKVEKAQRAVEAADAATLREQNRVEAAAEKRRKQLVEANDLKMLQAANSAYQGKGGFSEAELEMLAGNQLISASVYKGITDRMRDPGAEYDNPLVVGEILQLIERKDFDTAKTELDRAFQYGQVTSETYMAKIQQMGKGEYTQAISYLSRAIEPPEWYASDTEKQRYADAVRDMDILIKDGAEPMDAALRTAQLYRGRTAKKLSQLRTPRFLVGDRLEQRDLQETIRITTEKYVSGAIGPEAYDREIRLIKDTAAAVGEMQRYDDAGLDEKAKTMKVGK